MGSLDMAEDAARYGARFITHLFNAMLPVNIFTNVFCSKLFKTSGLQTEVT